MRSLRKYRFILVLAFIALGIFGLIRLLTSQTSLRFAVEKIQDSLEREYGLRLEVGDLEVSASDSTLYASPVILRDASGEKLFSAKSLSVDVEPIPFFSKKVVLTQVVLDEPALHIRIQDGKILGLSAKPKTKEKKKKSSPIFVSGQNIRLNNARLRVDVNGEHSLKLSKIKARLKERGEDGHRLKFSVGEGSAEFTDKEGTTRKALLDAFDGRLSVFGNGLLAPERVSVSGVSLATTDAELDVSGSVLLGDLRLAPAVDLDISLRTSFATLAQTLGLPVSIDGAAAVSARASADFGGENARVRGQANVRDFAIDTLKIGSMRTAFELNKERLQLTQTEVDNGGTTVFLNAELKLAKPFALQGEARGKDYSVAELLHDLHGTKAWANLVAKDAAVGFSGTLLPFKIEGAGQATLGDIRVGSGPVSELKDEDLVLRNAFPFKADMDFFVDAERIAFDGTVTDGKTKIVGLTQIFLDADRGMTVDATVPSVDFESVGGRIAGLDFEGRGSGTIKVGGPYETILIESDTQLDDFVLSDFSFGDLQGHVRYEQTDTRLLFQKLIAKKNKSAYQGDVELTFGRKNEVRTKTNTEGERLTQIVRGLHIGVDLVVKDAQAQDLRAIIPATDDEGALGFLRELELDGPISGPLRAAGYIGDGTTRALNGNATLALRSGAALLGQRLEGGTVRVEMNDASLDLPRIDLQVAGGTALASLSIHRDSSALSGEFSLDDLELGRIDALSDTDPFLGTASAKGTLNNLAENPGATGTLTLSGAMWGDVPIGDAALNLAHQNRQLQLEGSLLSTRGTGEIVISTEEPFAYSAAIKLREGPARTLLPKDLLPQDLKSRVAGEAFANGSLSDFSRSRGTLSLNKASFDFGQFKLNSPGDVLAHFSGSRLTIDQLEMVSQRNDTLSLRGLFSTDDIDLQMRAEGALWFAPSFTDNLDSASGDFRMDLSLTGTTDNTKVRGAGRLTDARFGIHDFEKDVIGLDARFLFTGNEVEIERARATLGDAPVEMKGSVFLESLSPRRYDLALNYRNLELETPEWLMTRTSGALTLRGDVAFPTLSGDVTVHRAAYETDIDWEQMLPDLSRTVKAPLVFNRAAEDVRLDVHLVADRGIVVQNDTMDIEAKGELTLTGTDERPGLIGNLSLLGGEVTFRNNRYSVARGTIEFTDAYRIAPLFNIEAETRVRDYEVETQILGPLGDLKIALASTPPLDEIDIVSLLTFGFTQFEASAESGQSVGISAGLEVVSAYTGLEDEVQRLLPKAVREASGLAVSELRLTSMFSTSNGTNRPAVAVGFEIDPKVALVGGSRLRLQSTLVEEDGNGNQQSAEWSKRFDNDLRLRVVWRSLDRGSCPTCRNQWGDPGFDFWYRWEFQ